METTKELKPSFIFDIGDVVVWRKHTLPAKVIECRREEDYFLSEVHGYHVFYNVYLTETVLRGLRGGKRESTYNLDKEILLTSYDVKKPRGAVDYQSDEYTADWLDKDGRVLKTVKSGEIGYANDVVRESFADRNKVIFVG